MRLQFAMIPRLIMGLGIGLGIGIPLALAAFLSGSLGPNETTASEDGTIPACVNRYTQAVRVGMAGQSLNCNAIEYQIQLGTGEPAKNLNLAVKSDVLDISNSLSLFWESTISCEAGETAINGGSRLLLNGTPVGSSDFNTLSSGPVGSPPTGWMISAEYETAIPTPGFAIEAWALCVS